MARWGEPGRLLVPPRHGRLPCLSVGTLRRSTTPGGTRTPRSHLALAPPRLLTPNHIQPRTSPPPSTHSESLIACSSSSCPSFPPSPLLLLISICRLARDGLARALPSPAPHPPPPIATGIGLILSRWPCYPLTTREASMLACEAAGWYPSGGLYASPRGPRVPRLIRQSRRDRVANRSTSGLSFLRSSH